MTIATTSLSLNSGVAMALMDTKFANSDYSGMGLYQGAFVRAGSADYRVGSFNVGSGAWLSAQLLQSAIASGADIEISEKLSAADMDRYIDETIMTFRVRREVTIPVNGSNFYAIDGAASPNTIKSVLNAYYYADASSTTNRLRRHDLTQEQVVFTATGMELRLPMVLTGSQQIVLDALLQMSLPAGDAATINLGPLVDEETILWGAAARCYDRIIQDAPGKEAGEYERRRKDAVRQWNRESAKARPQIDSKIGFDSAFEGQRRPDSDPLDWR